MEGQRYRRSSLYDWMQPLGESLSGYVQVMLDLETLVSDFAEAMVRVDAHAPVAINVRTKDPYQPGIGPHTEAQTVLMVMADLAATKPETYVAHEVGVPYADGSRQKCDLCLGEPPSWEWAVEVKMIRMLGDNGKPNDNMPLHVLSPYPSHRSALTDCDKLLASGLGGRKAILMFGYESDEYPVDDLLEAFVVLASERARLRPEVRAEFDGLIHPVHSSGVVMAWELLE